MNTMIKNFKDLEPAKQSSAGGKGGTLARLFQAGYPIPDGFVILPEAFAGDDLTPAAWHLVEENLERFRQENGKSAFAVRSSAMAEDSAAASFAGEFETILDVHTNETIYSAIQQVYHSRKAERVRAYTQAKGLSEEHDIAVIVQKLVRSEISGILFTADPVSGSRLNMAGNYVYGFGDALVSGEVEPYTFTLQRPKGRYDGPKDFKKYAKRLFKMAVKLEKELGTPQDIEWTIADGKLYLLQSRPITTLLDYDPTTGEYNSSMSGDYLWIGHEVFPDVMTPATISLFKYFHNFTVAGMKGTGNIGGRFYMNYSMMKALMWAFGQKEERIRNQIELSTGFRLKNLTSPDVPVSRWEIIRQMIPIQRQLLPLQNRLMKRFDEIIDANSARCKDIRNRIRTCQNPLDLSEIWFTDVYPLFFELIMVQDKANENYFFPYIAARKYIIKLIGEAEADPLLISLVGGEGELTSLGPMLGLEKLARGEISRETYTELSGHRLLQEDELSVPRPYEDPMWIEKRLQEFKEAKIDYQKMLKQRAAEIEKAWGKFSLEYPKHVEKLRKEINKISTAMAKREIIRSELTRSIGVVRAWFLRAGELTGLNEDIFFIEEKEVHELLKGNDSMVPYIPVRKETYERLVALPKYPMVISGRFDPYLWAKDPNRRSDVFDSHSPVKEDVKSDTLKGHPGSAGVVEGKIRIIHSPANSDEFVEGEILVASSTNVGWTPLFPKAAAVITDVGAPLSHAAIVARELGIPAVVGTNSATQRLKTGDRVQVDGGHGIVKILQPTAN